MQYLCYTPEGAQCGTFFFPTIAMVRYIEGLIERYGMSDHRQTLREMLVLARTPQTCIDLHAGIFSMDFYAADLIDRGTFTVVCPRCADHYTPSQIHREEWHSPLQLECGGRRYCCPLGHELLSVQDWMR
ncbi:MAG: hypothetical protein HC915_04680 [Anaerolineae bacterium]|nr:hypothetical protein [Anaerolineae bacterium]